MTLWDAVTDDVVYQTRSRLSVVVDGTSGWTFVSDSFTVGSHASKSVENILHTTGPSTLSSTCCIAMKNLENPGCSDPLKSCSEASGQTIWCRETSTMQSFTSKRCTHQPTLIDIRVVELLSVCTRRRNETVATTVKGSPRIRHHLGRFWCSPRAGTWPAC